MLYKLDVVKDFIINYKMEKWEIEYFKVKCFCIFKVIVKLAIRYVGVIGNMSYIYLL